MRRFTELQGRASSALALKTEDELVQYFALSAGLSAKLRPNMIKAEAIAVSQDSNVQQ